MHDRDSNDRGPEGSPPSSGSPTKLILIMLLCIFGVVFYLFTSTSDSGYSEIGPDEFALLSKKGSITLISREYDDTGIAYFDGIDGAGMRFRTQMKDTDPLYAGIIERHPGVEAEKRSEGGGLLGLIFTFLPWILFCGIMIFIMRRAGQNVGDISRFNRSRAHNKLGKQPNARFDDVAGEEEAKEELQEVVSFLRNPAKFLALGAKIPKGVLMVGPPGCGKTLMARAVAGESGVPFFSMSGSEFVEMFVGVGASRVRDLFDQAKRNAPCIIFLDELDAVGRHRGAGLGGGNDEREQTLNQILVEMDGFDSNASSANQIIVMAATNRPDILDPALLRPGRFDRRVTLDNPDVRGRMAILKVHSKGKPLAEEIDFEIIAKQTIGFSGADLANLVNEAAIRAARRSNNKIEHEDFTDNIDKVMAGPERKSRVISPKEKEMTAYHEAGHALVAHMIEDADEPYKVTIVSRGQTGGHTRYLPDEDRTLWTKKKFEGMLAAALGGRVAEELIFRETTTGASNDLQQATGIARAMVMQYGMSDKLGPRTFGKREEMVFLGKEISEQRDYGDEVARVIDEEIDTLLEAARKTAEEKLEEGKKALGRLAEHLIENETIEGDELQRVLDGTNSEE